MRPAQFTFAAADRDGVAKAQTTAGATALVLNGALVPSVQVGLSAVAQLGAGINRTVSIYSAADLSGITFTVDGYDANGAAITEDVTGPTAGATVYSTALFNQVTSVTPDGAVGTAVEIGSGTTGATNWYTVDYFQDPANIALWLQITATLSATVQMTPDDLNGSATPHTFNHAYLTAITSDAASALNYPARGVRALINSSSGSGALVFTIIQAGAGVP